MINCIEWCGMQAVELVKGDYTALLVPAMGANLVRLRNNKLGVELLRTPDESEIEEFKNRPQVFGTPLLFPPNRIEDGQYCFDGRVYQYPITRPTENNYHHGILKSQPFVVSKANESEFEAMVECRYYSNGGNDAIFRHFNHEFKCKVVYRLTNNGLEQEVIFTNKSTKQMPVGVGYHTAMQIPFAGGSADDYLMRCAVGEEVELSERNMPTGNKLELSHRYAKMRNEGLQVTGCEHLEASFTVSEIDVDGQPFRGAVVENKLTGVRAFYEVDAGTTSWTIWNNGGQVPYCCPEPQSWTTNAPNAPDPVAEGFRSIAPGESWGLKFWFYAK